MTSRDFAYWLQGFFELENPQSIDAAKTELIKKHLNLVFLHEIDPSMGDENHQAKLNAVHHGAPVTELSEDEKIAIQEGFGPKPSPNHVLSSLHGWYDPKQGTPRC